MSASLRTKVLAAFKEIHKARLQVFKGDERALAHTRNEINNRYRENIAVKNQEEIENLIKLSNECGEVLKKHVVQFESIDEEKVDKPTRYRVNITKDTHLMDNKEFQENVSRKELMQANYLGKEKSRKNLRKKMTNQ